MQETITQIPLEQLRESPFNPRLIFTGLEELAASIKAEGRIHEPLLVRPITGSAGDFEIVFGHRRFRAAGFAGLDSAPCMVRAMSDAEARSAQVAENLQRRDVHPLEEAVAFQAIIDQDGISADELAELHGKSRSYVYSRLKLNALCDQVREPFLKGEIDAEVALLIARLRTPKFQEKALGYIRGKYYDLEDGGAKSYRQIRSLLNERFALELKGAIFDTADALLLEIAGACTTCPKRSGNAPEFADVVADGGDEDVDIDAMSDEEYQAHLQKIQKRSRYSGARFTGADICTDPDCFDAKKKAHLKIEAAKLEQAGKTVVDGAKARQAVSATGEVKGAYVALKDVKAELKKVKGDAKPEVITIQDPRTGKLFEAVKAEELKAAGVKVKAAPRRNDYAAQQAEGRARHEKALAEAKAMTERNEALLDRLLPVMATQPRTTRELYWMAERVFEGTDWDVRNALAKRHGFNGSDKLEKAIGQWPADRLALFAIECVLLGDAVVEPHALYGSGKPRAELLEAAAEHYGVPLDEPASTPTSAAQAQESAPAAPARKALSGKKKRKGTPAGAGDEQTDDAGSAGGSDAESGELFEGAV